MGLDHLVIAGLAVLGLPNETASLTVALILAETIQLIFTLQAGGGPGAYYNTGTTERGSRLQLLPTNGKQEGKQTVQPITADLSRCIGSGRISITLALSCG